MNDQPAQSPPSPGGLPARLEWLTLLAALAAAVLIYPLKLRDADAIATWWDAHPGFWTDFLRLQIEPFIQFWFSPLILKGALAGIAMLAFAALWLARRILRPAAGGQGEGGQSPWAWLTWVGFFAWIIFSAAWSPTPAIAREAAAWAEIWGISGYVMLRRGMRHAELVRLGALLIAMGAVVTAIIYLQALPIFRGRIAGFLYTWDESARNRYGSLLGHNTAAAAYLMMSAFPALAFALTARRRVARWAAGAYLASLALALVVLQSRAVWILAPILGLLALRSALRQVGRRRMRRVPALLLVVLAGVLLTQTVNRPWNPLYVRDNPLARRLKDLSPESLMGEARLRLNVIGVRLVPEHPLIGHGLFAYQYIYPRFQGRYFHTHPESPLGRTVARSNMAHNEYLQVAIDHGLIGLVLLLAFLGEAARRGWRRRRTLAAPDRLLHEAFGWGALSFVLHALVDFPFHVPQLALPGLACLAAWGALRPADGKNIGKNTAAVPTETAAPGGISSVHPAVILRLTMAALLLAAVPFLAVPLGRALASDVRFMEGSNALNRIQYAGDSPDTGEKRELTRRAIELLSQSVHYQPANYLAMQSLGQAVLTAGALWTEQYLQAVDNATPAARAARARAIEALKQSLEIFRRTGEGLDYHLLFYQQAEAWRMLNRLDPSPAYARNYRDNLEKTIERAPTYVEALYELSEMLAATPNPNAARILEMRRTIRENEPYYFDVKYVYTANYFTHNQLYEQGAAAWEQILAVDPTCIEWLGETSYAEFMAGHRARALEIIERMNRQDWRGIYQTGAALTLATLQGDWVELLNLIEQFPTTIPEKQAEYRALEIELRRRLDLDPAITELPTPAIASAEWTARVAAKLPFVLLHYFNDPTAARRAFEARMEMEGAPGLKFWIDGVEIALALGDIRFGRDCLDGARRADPNYPAISAAAARLEKPAETKSGR